MDSFEWNKIFGAVLAVCLFMMGLGIVAEVVFHEEDPEQPGYAIEVAEVAPAGAAVEEETPIAVLLASADPAAGENVAKKCLACHVFEEGGPNKVGPDLWGVVGRTIGSVENFSYSDTLAQMGNEGKVWDFEALNHFLENPRGWAPGTIMAFAGLRKDEERANMIAYLQTLSNNPVPLPEPEPAAAEETEVAPAETAPADAAPTEGAAPATESAPSETAPVGENQLDRMGETMPGNTDPAEPAINGNEPVTPQPAEPAPADATGDQQASDSPQGEPAVEAGDTPALAKPTDTMEELAPSAAGGAVPEANPKPGTPVTPAQ
jgi:cytochrome c